MRINSEIQKDKVISGNVRRYCDCVPSKIHDNPIYQENLPQLQHHKLVRLESYTNWKWFQSPTWEPTVYELNCYLFAIEGIWRTRLMQVFRHHLC